MEENFKDIAGYEGLYQISNLGNVRSLKFGKERILKTGDIKGYLVVGLCKEGVQKNHLVHRLVAEAFIDNPNNLPEVNHKDEDKTNNHVTNLEWCDNIYNINYGTHTERSVQSRRNNKKQSKQVLCVETGIIYPSAREVYRQLGFNNSHICSCCNGKRNTCGGYNWKYVI